MSCDVLDMIDEWGPEKIICVSDPRTGMEGVLVIDNSARGLGKGGLRMSPTLTVGEVAGLARTMTWKWAMLDLFYGGAKAGIRADPRNPKKEEIIRSWMWAMRRHIPSDYVAGLDMGMVERDGAIMQDALDDKGVVVGTPGELGGVPYDELGLTGFGVAECVGVAAEFAGLSLEGASVAIQGFGAVGFAAAKRLDELGACLVGVSTSEGVLYDKNGLDVAQLLQLRKLVGDALIHAYDGGTRLELGAELTLPVDILIPAAVQNAITEDNVDEIQARILVEGANLPSTRDAQARLSQRGITHVPDFVANAGAPIGAAVAMDARYSAFRPDPQEIYTMISDKLTANAGVVLRTARERGITSHQAALAIAQKRVARAMELKGRRRQDAGQMGGTP